MNSHVSLDKDIEQVFAAAISARIEIQPAVLGSALGSRDWDDLSAFRQRQLSKRAPWLLLPENLEREREADIDRLATHVLIRRDSALIGAVRLTLSNFEFATNSPELAEVAEPLTGHMEISRLVVDPNARALQVTKCLFAAAARYGMACGARGVVALCRPSAARLFQGFGLHPYEARTYQLQFRCNQEYLLLVASWLRIAEAISP